MATCKRCGRRVEKQYDMWCFYYFCECGGSGMDIYLTDTEKLRDQQELEEMDDECF